MEIETQKIKKALIEAFDFGSRNPMDCREEVVIELCKKYGINDEEENYRLWTVEELSQMPLRSTFHHATMGRCWVSQNSEGKKFMRFNDHGQAEFRSNVSPWNVEMKLVYKPPQ